MSDITPRDVIAALSFLGGRGVDIIAAPAKWKARGYDFWARSEGQMLTRAQLVEFADNERSVR